METLNARQQNIDPMNRTYSKESLQTQFVNYHNNMASQSGNGVPASRLSASRRQSRTISSSNFENLPIVEGARYIETLVFFFFLCLSKCRLGSFFIIYLSKCQKIMVSTHF